MNIVFCTTCKGRTQHLERTLPLNLWGNPDAKFVVVDYNSPDHLVTYLQQNHKKDIEAGRLVVYHYRGRHPFRMAHAKNMAHRLGILEGGDVLCNVDADNFTPAGFDKYLAETIQPDTFLWSRMIKGELKRGISGRIAVTSHAFLKCGGYDEKFREWGPDDKDFCNRLERLGYNPAEIDQRYLDAIMHNHKIRFKEYPEAETGIYGGPLDAEEDTTIANWGDVGCGRVYRNFDFSAPIELLPIPTRIFGIGLHKTGTTSLHHALEILGFDSWHWKTAHQAKRIWAEMEFGRSALIEDHYAFSDLPIPLLYGQLDAAYPGSKFILTRRDERSWLKSVESHWNPDRNKFQCAWDTDPFTHKVHSLLYGRKTFDRGTMLARYRQHNAEVREYFQNRPGDLLEMDLSNHAGWPELCAFVNRKIPEAEYPMAYQTDATQTEKHHHHHQPTQTVATGPLWVRMGNTAYYDTGARRVPVAPEFYFIVGDKALTVYRAVDSQPTQSFHLPAATYGILSKQVVSS